MSPCIRLVRVLTVFITLLGQYVGASPLHMIEPSGSDLVQVESHVVATRQGGGELLELTAEIVEIGAHAIADLVGKKVDQDHDKMSAFTQSTAAQMSKNWPNKNVMVVHGSHDQNFVDEVHSHHELDIIVGGTIGYEIYVFTSGDFTLHSDGGYINWCFMGNFQRGDGGYVKFDPIQGMSGIEGDFLIIPTDFLFQMHLPLYLKTKSHNRVQTRSQIKPRHQHQIQP